MKNLILTFALVGVSLQTYAQNVSFKAKLNKEDVPTAVLEAVQKDFPSYTVDEYATLPVDIVEEDVYFDTNRDPGSVYDAYQLDLTEGTGRTLEATYNSIGKLMSTVEQLKNITPPAPVRNSIEAKFPGWTIEKDAYKMVHFSGEKAKERYKLILGKNDSKMKVYTDQNGKILKVS